MPNEKLQQKTTDLNKSINASINENLEEQQQQQQNEWEILEVQQEQREELPEVQISGSVQGEIVAQQGQQPEQVPIHPQYIGFDRAYAAEQAKDSSRMKAIRQSLRTYYDIKDALEADHGDKYLLYERLVDALERVIENCKSYRFFRHSLFSYGSTRRQEVVALQEKIETELMHAREEYFAFAENEYGQVKADPTLKRRTITTADKVHKITLGPKKGNLSRLNIEYLAELDGSEYTTRVDSKYMKNRTKYDLKRKDIELSDSDRKLLERIGKFVDTSGEGRRLGYLRGRLMESVTQAINIKGHHILSAILSTVSRLPLHLFNFAKWFAYDIRQVRANGREYISLLAKLREVVGNETIPQEKRDMFKVYLERLEVREKGMLDLSNVKEEDIRDYTDSEGFVRSDGTKDKNGNANEDSHVFWDDRSDEPLFVHEPNPMDIVQGYHGNCFALASIAQVVSKDPKAVMGMFKDEGEKGVVVRLYHQEGEEMKPVYFRVDKRVSSGCNWGALWVSVLFNAMIAYRQTYPETYNIGDESSSESVVKEAVKKRQEQGIKKLDVGLFANGGFMNEVLPMLTGKKYMNALEYSNELEMEWLNVGEMSELIYAKNTSKAQRVVDVESGEVLNEEFAVFTRKSKDDREVKVVHNKAVFDELCEKFSSDEAEMMQKIEENDALIKEKRQLQEKIIAEAEQFYLETQCAKEDEAKYRQYAKSVREIMYNRYGNRNENEYGGYGGLARLEHAVDEFDQNKLEQCREAHREEEKLLKENANLVGKFMVDHDMDREGYDVKQKASLHNNVFTNDKLPADKQRAKKYMKQRKMDIDVLLQECTNKILKKPMHRANTMDEGTKTQDKVLKIQEELNSVDYSDFPEPESRFLRSDDVFDRLARIAGKSREEVFNLAKRNAVTSVEKIMSDYDMARREKMQEIYTGVYSDTALSMYQQIKSLTDKGAAVGAGTRSAGGNSVFTKEDLMSGIAGSHAYSVLGVQELSFMGKRIKMVKLRNPWGGYAPKYKYNSKTGKVETENTYNNNGGVFLMELTHFWQRFDEIFTTNQ